jgi:hypothetical protein
MLLRYLHFATHGSLLTSIFAVWERLPFPVEHLVVLAFSENNGDVFVNMWEHELRAE